MNVIRKRDEWKITDSIKSYKIRRKEKKISNKNSNQYVLPNLFKSILSIVVPSAAAPLIPEADPKTLLTTAVDCEGSTSKTR